MRIGERDLAKPLGVEQRNEALQGPAVDHVDRPQDLEKSVLHTFVGVVFEHSDQVVEALQRGGDLSGQASVRHGDSPLLWDHQPQPTASIGCSPRGIAATSAAVTA